MYVIIRCLMNPISRTLIVRARKIICAFPLSVKIEILEMNGSTKSENS